MSLLDDLAAGRLAASYLLFGSEPGPIGEHVQAIRRAVLDPATEAFNHERFTGRDLDSTGAVLEACAQLPVLGRHRLVELSDPEAIGKGRGAAVDNKPAIDALVAYVGDPNPSTVFVITSSGIDARSRIVGAIKKHGVVERFDAFKRDADAQAWLAEHAARKGIALSRPAAARLVALVGTGPTGLAAALEQASVHAGAGARVEPHDVDAVVSHTREAVIFDLTDAVGMGDARRALAVLARLFHETGTSEVGVFSQVLSMLVRQIRLVFVARQAGPARIGEAAGVPPFVARKLAEQVRGWDEARLRRAYAGLARLDRDLKGGSAAVARAPYVALQRFVLDACGAMPDVASRV